MTTKVQKWGNSLAVRIPREVAEQLMIEQGSDIRIEVNDKEIKLIPTERKQTLEELLAQIKPENRHDEIDFGKPEGKELL